MEGIPMKSLTSVVIIAGLVALCAPQSRAKEPSPIPASDRAKNLVFQMGADAFGGGLSDVTFIGGGNVTILYPALRRLWVGLRPSAHLIVQKDSDYDVAWFHPDVAAHFNLLHDPVRLYLLGAVGYSLAIDTDLYGGVAHGWSASGGVGAAWRPRGGPLGIFAELAFRGGHASRDQSELVLDASGKPICDDDCQIWQVHKVSREFDLVAITVNLGLIYVR
jgi:hypothetical protein